VLKVELGLDLHIRVPYFYKAFFRDIDVTASFTDRLLQPLRLSFAVGLQTCCGPKGKLQLVSS
jgi:hypothetical protein